MKTVRADLLMRLGINIVKEHMLRMAFLCYFENNLR
jgi:hypothetical protein